jgi:pimeloyl-ACP methyl ester carboxylesterase
MIRTISYRVLSGLVVCLALVVATGNATAGGEPGVPPPGFSAAKLEGLNYVRGGQGPAVILVHGFPEDWVEYRAIMPRLAKHFTVVAVDLPGIHGSRSRPRR